MIFDCGLDISSLICEILQVKLGWTEAAMMAGARDIGMSPSIVGSFARKEAELVEVYSFSSLIVGYLDFFQFPLYILDNPFESVICIT